MASPSLSLSTRWVWLFVNSVISPNVAPPNLSSDFEVSPSSSWPIPAFNSGFMIPQYAAASMVSQNKMYAWPASCDSIVSSNGQEDLVSMGANAATKLHKIIDNLHHIAAIELINAAQGLEFRRPLKSSPYIEKVLAELRKVVPFVEEDVVMEDYLAKTMEFLNNFDIDIQNFE